MLISSESCKTFSNMMRHFEDNLNNLEDMNLNSVCLFLYFSGDFSKLIIRQFYLFLGAINLLIHGALFSSVSSQCIEEYWNSAR